MNKRRKDDDAIPVLVTSERVKDFFARGREIAKLIDQKKPIPSYRIISFEDPNDLVKFLTQNKLRLVSMVRRKPDSITGLAKTLKRSRASVDRDVQELESVGIVTSKYMINPGHGKCKIIMATDTKPVKLQVQTII